MGDYAKAESLLQRALKIREKALGPEHAATASSLNDLAGLYQAKGDYAKAEPLYQRALKIREKALGPEHPVTATSLNNLAELYGYMGDYAKAESLYQRALKIREKALGPEHPGTAATLNDLAGLYNYLGDYAKAEQLFQRALQIREKALGLDHPVTAASVERLGGLYRGMGDHAKAEPLFQRALKIREKSLGPEHPVTAISLNGLAGLYADMGDYAKAESLYQRALKIREKALGPEHPATEQSLTSLGWLHLNMGDYAKAEPLLQRALKIKEKALGLEHPETGRGYQNLGVLYSEMGDYAKAEPLLQRGLKIREKALGPDHRDVATNLTNLAWLYRKMGDYAKAEPLLQRALKIYEKALGPEHPMTAYNLQQLALLYYEMGDYTKAEPLLQRALKINEKALGPEHTVTGENLYNLGELYAVMGNTKEALRLAVRGRQAHEKSLFNILSFTSEQQRLAFQKRAQPYNLPANLGSARELGEIVLRQKGVVLDSLLEDRLVAEASQDPKQREVVSELRSAKRRLMQLQLETPKDLSDQTVKKREAEKNELFQRVEELEAGLARQVTGLGRARRALSVTVERVQAAIVTDEALIELLRYDHYLGKNKSEPCYGAVVIAPRGEPKWIPLESAKEIDKSIALYQKSVRGKTDEATLSSALHTLDTQLWAPIEKALPAETKTIIISPDGELSFVSFATLLTADDRFVGEKYSIRYVASGRDLLREFKTTNNSQANVYANPDFGGRSTSPDSKRGTAVALRTLEMRDLETMSLPPLPGTAAEAAALQKRFGNSAKVYLGVNATKAQLQQVDSPHILHLATHGFFLPEIELPGSNDPFHLGANNTKPQFQQVDSTQVPDLATHGSFLPEIEPAGSSDPFQQGEGIPKAKLVNPMHRSGLALAGAQTTLNAWSRGDVPPIENNGIVTAEEVGGLKLDGTWLVVLSACETGSGEARAGEGVMGLRRGFIQAGAQNLLMTLWPISDETTVQIMLDFYDAADKTKNAPQALADVQRDWLVKLRKEHGLLEAVRLAGPFIMSSQGKQ
jgi:tetratricopeptide (TPR) repeat protein